MKMKELKTSNITLKELKEKTITKGWATSVIGSIVYFVLGFLCCTPHYYFGIPYFEIGKGWGGVEMGWFFIVCKDNDTHLKNHEVGHLVQNAEVGGLSMVWWSLCSCVRYWWREIFGAKTTYDSWWFEGNATALGNEFINRIKGE
jgi:hypothetical protein